MTKLRELLSNKGFGDNDIADIEAALAECEPLPAKAKDGLGQIERHYRQMNGETLAPATNVAQSNLSQEDYDNLVRDAMQRRKQKQ